MSKETLKLKHPGGIIRSTIQLTGSKSESNRALILNALSKGKVRIENLSHADDTVTLKSALDLADKHMHDQALIDIGPAGTAMRFLTAYLTLAKGRFKLTGSDRMKQRPIGILVDALRQLGAHIDYAATTGYPPLYITGGFEQTSKNIDIQGDVSSQYLSALLLVAAFLPQGLCLNITSTLTSRPYVTMTLDMLQEVGIDHTWEGNQIIITNQDVKDAVLTIEPDWSAASYWYAIIALSPVGSKLFLSGLKDHSLQGDRAIVDIMKNFGICSTFKDGGVEIENTGNTTGERFFDFKECPDLAQTVISCCAALGYNARFTGLETLKIKETDRILALQNELSKFEVLLIAEENQVYYLNTDAKINRSGVRIQTYEDHRMAMAFAPLAIVFDELTIEDPEVVGKSYPTFWQHLTDIGFHCKIY